MKSWFNRVRSLAVFIAAAGLIAACEEQLDSGLACPALCPQQQTSIRDTTILAVAFDTALAGYPPLGTELQMFIASLGDTLETRGVMRWDSLPNLFRQPNSPDDSLITSVDTGAVIKFRLGANDTLAGPVTIELYDVDLGGPDDDDPTSVDTAFTAARLLGSQTFEAAELKDSIAVPIDRDVLLAKILMEPPANRLRLGIRVAPTGQARLSIFTANAGGAALLQFRPTLDTSVNVLRIGVRSKFPEQAFLASNLADYLLVVKEPSPPPPDVLRVGGIPGYRAYLRFDIPSSILDSSSVVRATLQLTQRPNLLAPEPFDTISLQQFAITAGPAVTDLRRALLFLNISSNDSLHLVSADSGLKEFEMIGLVRAWRSTTPDRTIRALALRSVSEGRGPRQVDFYSIEAPAGVQPRLRLSYVPRVQTGIP